MLKTMTSTRLHGPSNKTQGTMNKKNQGPTTPESWVSHGWRSNKTAPHQSTRERQHDRTHTANSQKATHTETCIFARRLFQTGKALVDSGATKSMGSGGATSRFSWYVLGPYKEDMVHFCKFKRQEGEGQVAVKVNAGGRVSDCEIKVSEYNGSVHSLVCTEFVTIGSNY